MMDPVRRNILATGAAAATVAAAPQVFAQSQGAKFYERGPVRIRYTEAGAGTPLLIIPGGGLNSTIAQLTAANSPFDPIAAQMWPPLTTVRWPVASMAVMCANLPV